MPKQLIGRPRSVPVLESTGEASPIQPFQIYLKNLLSKSGRLMRSEMAFATLLYAFLGVSSGNRYPLEIVATPTSSIHSGKSFPLTQFVVSAIKFPSII